MWEAVKQLGSVFDRECLLTPISDSKPPDCYRPLPAAVQNALSGADRFALRAGLGPLELRSIYHLSGEARKDWEHSIIDKPEPRWSVTFRSLR